MKDTTKRRTAITAGLAGLVLAGGMAVVAGGTANAAPVSSSVQANLAVRGAQGANDSATGQSGSQSATGTDTESTSEPVETSAETATPADGPGGHQDPAGDVQHNGGANEQ